MSAEAARRWRRVLPCKLCPSTSRRAVSLSNGGSSPDRPQSSQERETLRYLSRHSSLV